LLGEVEGDGVEGMDPGAVAGGQGAWVEALGDGMGVGGVLLGRAGCVPVVCWTAGL
jgi:hypothetical protein